MNEYCEHFDVDKKACCARSGHECNRHCPIYTHTKTKCEHWNGDSCDIHLDIDRPACRRDCPEALRDITREWTKMESMDKEFKEAMEIINDNYCKYYENETCVRPHWNINDCMKNCAIYSRRALEPEGKKYDTGKARWDLLPMHLIDEAVSVLSFGANKYGEESWRYVTNGLNRYYAALIRHIRAYREGEENDSESGYSHLAHAMCNLIFLSELQREVK